MPFQYLVISVTATFHPPIVLFPHLPTFIVFHQIFKVQQAKSLANIHFQTQFSSFKNMNDRIVSSNQSDPHSNVLNIYPITSYYFGSKQASYSKEQTLAHDRIHPFKFNFDENGTRTVVQAVILVELFKHPHLLLLQSRNSIYKLPGGRLRQGELEIECLQRKLSRKLSMDDKGNELEWEVGECLGMWWRPDFQTVLYPYLPHNIKRPKECTKLYLVKLPESRKFIVPKNFKLLAVPLCQVHENHKTYGPIISGVPQLLSRFSFNVIGS